MKKRIFCLVLAMTMVVSPMVVSAQENDVVEDVQSEEVEEFDLASFDLLNAVDLDSCMEEAGMLDTEPLDFSEEDEEVADESNGMLGGTVEWTFYDNNNEGYTPLSSGDSTRIVNGSDSLIIINQVDAKGTIIDSVALMPGKRASFRNSQGFTVNTYFKYTGSTHTLLLTSQKPNMWKFYDVFPSSKDWKFNGVLFCTVNKFMNGTGGNSFSPNTNLSRGMMTTTLYNCTGTPKVTYQSFFNDVPAGKYYSIPVTWGYKNKIVSGTGAAFKPDSDVTREQLAVMFKNYSDFLDAKLPIKKIYLPQYPDYTQISSWATSAVEWAIGQGVISGKNYEGRNYIDPKGKATRAEAATIVYNYAKALGK